MEHKGINVFNERSLHAAIKQWYALPGDRFEVKLEGSVIDIVRGEKLIEVQTKNFSSISGKLKKLSEKYEVELIHPITHLKWVTKICKRTGTVLSTRKSSKKGSIISLFEELVYIPALFQRPNFSLLVIMINEEEIRCEDGKGSKKRKRASLIDRKLREVTGQRRFSSASDFLTFIPSSLYGPFSNKTLAAEMNLPIYEAGRITYCLKNMGAIHLTHKSGNEQWFEVANSPDITKSSIKIGALSTNNE